MPPSSWGSGGRARVRAPAQLKARLSGALRITILSFGWVELASAAAPPGAADCARLDDDAARLACYDGHNPPNKSVARTPSTPPPPLAAAKTPAPAAVAPAPPRAAVDDPFGKQPDKPKPVEPDDLVAHVDAVSEKLTGELLLKLDNGQSWMQAQRKAGVRIKGGERVTFSRGTLGGYLLSSDSGATMRVRRLQ